MNIKLSNKEKVQDLLNLFCGLLRFRGEDLDYIQFYNCSTIHKRLNVLNIRAKFSEDKKRTFELNPNEARVFVQLISDCEFYFSGKTFETAFAISICEDLRKQVEHLKNRQRMFIASM